MTREEIEDHLRRTFEAELPGRIDRYDKSRVHPVIPDGYFAAASSECRDSFVSGNFYGCIVLAQSVGEGLAHFIAETNGLRQVDDHLQQINILQHEGSHPPISPGAYKGFRDIRGKDRNDFHHLNPNIEQDRLKLEARSLACLEGLFAVESEVFAVEFVGEGRIRHVHPQYWPTRGNETEVFVRFI
jgi:hypothetical protein